MSSVLLQNIRNVSEALACCENNHAVAHLDRGGTVRHNNISAADDTRNQDIFLRLQLRQRNADHRRFLPDDKFQCLDLVLDDVVHCCQSSSASHEHS